MRLPDSVSPLAAELSTAFADVLTPGQQRSLTGWVAGTLLAGTSCQTLVTAALVETLGVGSWANVRATRREFVYDGAEHSAPCRVEVDPPACFGPLLRWLLGAWPSRDLPLALHVTTHTDHLTAIVVSVLTAGRAIPVAWHILPGQQLGAFLDPTLTLLRTLAPVLGPAAPYRVTLAADRGLWSPALADHLTALGWIPLLRVQGASSVWLGQGQPVAADRLVAGPGHAWVGRVTSHKDRARRRVQTVLIRWLPGHAEPWVIVTTLPPTAAALCWYGLRMGIEAGFRDRKRLGWQWERTRRRDPTRVARPWLVLAVATIGALRHGDTPPTGAEPPLISALQRGRLRLLALVLGARRRAPAPLLPPHWPDPPRGQLTLTIWTAPLHHPGPRCRSPVNPPL